jgi:hypothetical protein
MAKTIGQLTSATTIANGDLFVIEQSSQTFKIAASVVRGGLIDADIDAAAAIAYGKLDLDDSIVAGDLTADAVTTAKILDANVTPAKLSQPYTLRTVENSTSGPSIDFTDIPSWAKRITVMLRGVSTMGTSNLIIQVGDAGGFETTGYTSGHAFISSASSAAGTSLYTIGFGLTLQFAAASVVDSAYVLTNQTGNVWIGMGTMVYATTGSTGFGSGSKTLSDTLTQVRITTANGTDTFDAGSINISYEG